MIPHYKSRRPDESPDKVKIFVLSWIVFSYILLGLMMWGFSTWGIDAPTQEPKDPFTVLCDSLEGEVKRNTTDKVIEVPRNWDNERLRVMDKQFPERYCQVNYGPGVAPGPVVAWADQ